MALILSVQSISKAFGAKPLFEDLSLSIADGERIGLIGPNGSGKTTFIQILAGVLEPDSGTRSLRKLARVGYVPQEARFAPGKTARKVLEEVIAGEDREERVAITLGRAGFTDFDVVCDTLSGGWKRRLSIARELVQAPDLVLFDEPTNHLDIEGILWLERLLASSTFASLLVSHDRYFLENVASDMAEINKVYADGIFRVRGPYSDFLEKREQYLEAQQKQQEALATVVKREIEWLRRGAKARTGKSKARIDNAGRLIGELADVSARNAKTSATVDFTSSDRKTKRLFYAEKVTKSLGGKRLFGDLTVTLGPGVRLGLLGLNGSGKSTLLKMIAGELEPDCGKIERADGLRIVYFDQGRQKLDPNATLREAIGANEDLVIYRGRPMHVAGWAKRFNFRIDQLEVAVGRLSGGEQARVLIARLMLEAADLLLLDEPTNDLDIATLEVLEESLTDFPGALVLVTHDRYMLDRVSNLVLGLDGQGTAEYFADYWQWEQLQVTQKPQPKAVKPAAQRAAQTPAKKKLSYVEAREFEQIETRIHEADGLVAALQAELHAPHVVSDALKLQDVYQKLQGAEADVEKLYSRWGELDAKVN